MTTDHTRPIHEIAERLHIPLDALLPFGKDIAKIDINKLSSLSCSHKGRLILVTAMTPTKAGEGKTTISIGLADALTSTEPRTVVCLREPSLGPYFGRKGGGTGGGASRLVPENEINLHFTGDMHAIGAAHNLLAAMLDNHLFHDNALDMDPARILWPRVLDINDRALRSIRLSPSGNQDANSHTGSFDITPASEIMAALCLAKNADDLKTRLERLIVAKNKTGGFVNAHDLLATGAMMRLLRNALLPNLVQTAKGTPAFVHGGAFANIAHGTSSLIALDVALAHARLVVTEAGFGADLGAEKFMNIAVRNGAPPPDLAVIVASCRALAYQGKGNIEAGLINLERHLAILSRFGVPALVALNRFADDEPDDIAFLTDWARTKDVAMAVCDPFDHNGAGCADLAQACLARMNEEQTNFRTLYADDAPLEAKMETVAREIYGAGGIDMTPETIADIADLAARGFGGLPICMAKTPRSLTADAKIHGAPTGHVLPIRSIRLAAGAGFIVALTGNVMTMPGLPANPAAESMMC
ncbi:MAG: formate--tetrahydrofolate ligase [Pseudomonadota bacterium]|nr:formate--tetrahydrofolate ligase [Pseudomonadota bacterium]